MNILHANLFPRNYLYEIYPEEYLINGRVSLNDFKAVILPHARYLPHALSGKLIDWVKAGGVLVPISASGLCNDLGIPDNSLMQTLLGMPAEELTAAAAASSKAPPMRYQEVGKGSVLFIANIGHLERPEILKRLHEVLDRTSGRNAWSENDSLEVLLRKDTGGDLYISVMNTDPDHVVTGTVMVPRRLQTAVDVTVANGCPIKTAEFQHDGRTGTQFQIRLNPAEWACIWAGRATVP